jgi:hypothetical protein
VAAGFGWISFNFGNGSVGIYLVGMEAVVRFCRNYRRGQCDCE